MKRTNHTYQFGFIIEQALGHVTHGQNLRALASQDPAVQTHWALPEFPVTGDTWSHES